MSTVLFAERTPLKQFQPKEGRFAYPLGVSAGGGDGLPFLVGSEVFTFNSDNINTFVKPKSIQSMWIDAFNFTASQLLQITLNDKLIQVAGAKQGYIVVAQRAPFTIKIAGTGGIGTVFIILYNYNIFYTGGSNAPGSNIANFKQIVNVGNGGIR